MYRMPLRTRLLALGLARRFPALAGKDAAQLARIRAGMEVPHHVPFTWVTGPINRRVRISDTTFTTRDGTERQVRVYRPEGTAPAPVVVFYHGGGWVLGSTRQYDPLCAQIAARIGVLVLSVDYRLSPEVHAPTAIHDAVDGLRWAATAAERFGGDATRLAVCGDSAGGNLAALVCHVVHDEGGPAIAHQALLYPGVDLSMSFPSIRSRATAPVLDVAKIVAFRDLYLGPGWSGDLRDPAISPYWRPDLRGLPPALVITADLDPLRDEGQAYAARLSHAGVPVRATNYLSTVHGFLSFPGATLIGHQALLELLTEQRRHLFAPTVAPV